MPRPGIDIRQQRRRERYLAVAALAALIFAAVSIYPAAKSNFRSSEPGDEAQMFRSIGSVMGNTSTGVSQEDISMAAGMTPAAAIRQVTAVRVQPLPLGPKPAGTGTTATSSLTGLTICLDAGHAANTNAGTEPIGPGSTVMKTTEPGGTTGVVSGVPEYKVTLEIAQRLRAILETQGARVVMVREGDTFDGLARDRTMIANNAHADLYVRIHCNGSTSQSTHGTSTLYPASIPGWTDDIAAPSRKAAQAVQAALVARLGSADLGIDERSDMLGFNWSDVPVILAEVGFMSNPQEDLRLTAADYQQRAAQGLAAGIASYFASR